MAIEQHSVFPTLKLVSHPLVQSKLTLLRDKNTVHKLFRELVYEITLLLGYEATQSLEMGLQRIDTPVESDVESPILAGPSPVILPILRAGIGMVDALGLLMPSAKTAHIGLFRNQKTLLPESYYFKIPQNSKKRPFFVCDPMLATGGSAIHAVNQLKDQGVESITFICILLSPEGMENFQKVHPDTVVYAAALDRCVNEKGYILPGLGDAGDRLFGTL